LLVELQHDFRSAEGMEQGPIGAGLDGIIGAVIAAPALDAAEIAALVVVAGSELLAGSGIGTQQLALEQRPGRWGHGLFERELHLTGRQDRAETESEQEGGKVAGHGILFAGTAGRAARNRGLLAVLSLPLTGEKDNLTRRHSRSAAPFKRGLMPGTR